MTTSREDQAGSFGRWLDQTPGSPPPADVDPDVVEAIYALRPDLAPAPRLTADDILARDGERRRVALVGRTRGARASHRLSGSFRRWSAVIAELCR